MASSERSRIELLRARLGAGGAASGSGVLLGIGDDAAALAPGGETLVWTIDTAVEGVHFRRDLLGFADLGFRATMAAASDLAAMGATPRGLLASLILPADVDDEALGALADGQAEAARHLGTAVIGGNLARGSELSITSTALGSTPEVLTRSGARVGDAIWLAGPVGLAAAGLAALTSPYQANEALAPAIGAWRRPLARIAAGVEARGVATAAIDVSDGLATDLGHIARASGVRAVIDPVTFVTPELRAAAAALGRDSLELALHGGEDYALIVVAPAGAGFPSFIRIGGFEPAASGAGDVALVAADGTLTPVADRGFDHFAPR